MAIETDVRVAGLEVGHVSAVPLNYQTYSPDAVLTIPVDIFLPTDSAAPIQQDKFFGRADISLHSGDTLKNFRRGDAIKGRPSRRQTAAVHVVIRG